MSRIQLHPPRCLRCAYVIQGLPSPGQCPECGREFDLSYPSTFTTRPPLVRWKLWAPGFALAAGVAFLLTASLAFGIHNWGWALFIGVPLSGGCILGYRYRGKSYALPLLGFGLLGSVILGLASLNLAGVFCGLVLCAILSIPIAIGCLMGACLRYEMKRRNFSQAGYLPILLFASIPVIWALLEGKHALMQVERVSTYTIVAAPPEACWKSIMFYEEVTHKPPLILRVGLAHPLSTTGSSKAVGDRKTCIYNKGRITKEITGVEPNARLSFIVTEQQIGYERDVRLLGGEFKLEPVEGGTRITLTTTYEPLLAPRFCWRPAERLAVHILHGHVLEGMKMKAEHPSTLAGAP